MCCAGGDQPEDNISYATVQYEGFVSSGKSYLSIVAPRITKRGKSYKGCLYSPVCSSISSRVSPNAGTRQVNTHICRRLNDNPPIECNLQPQFAPLTRDFTAPLWDSIVLCDISVIHHTAMMGRWIKVLLWSQFFAWD